VQGHDFGIVKSRPFPEPCDNRVRAGNVRHHQAILTSAELVNRSAFSASHSLGSAGTNPVYDRVFCKYPFVSQGVEALCGATRRLIDQDEHINEYVPCFSLQCSFYSAASTASQSAGQCTDAEASEAEDRLDHLIDWDHVYDAFKPFGHCDDGALAEGFSAAVAQLLTTKWETAERLSRLAAKDRKFARFVLLHVDDLMSPDEARLIVTNSRTKCPPRARALCRELAARVARMPR